MRNTVSQWIYSNSKNCIGLILIACISLISCLGFKEDRVVIQKNQIGNGAEVDDFAVSPMNARGDYLEFSIKKFEEVKNETKVKVTTSLMRDKDGTLCHTNSMNECANVNYYYALGFGTVFSFGLIIPVVLVFDWIPAIFRTGDSIVTEEATERKPISQCKVKNGDINFEYQIGEGRKRNAKVENCIAYVPLTSEFNSAYEFSYRLSVYGDLRDTGSLKYTSDSGPFGIIESKKFLAIQNHADRVRDKISTEDNRKAQIAREAADSRKRKQCSEIVASLAPYSPDLDLNRDAMCSLTCNKYAEMKFPRDSHRIIYECNRQCRECWDVLSGKSSSQPMDILNYESLRRPNSY